MKRIIPVLIFVLIMPLLQSSEACVGRIIHLGIVETPNDVFFAELIAVLINERTGTTVNVKAYEDYKGMYEAVEEGKVNIVVENTAHALIMLGSSKPTGGINDYDISKDGFRDRFSLIWLKPMGTLPVDGVSSHYSAVITEDVLVRFPALPRVINKLQGISSDKSFLNAIESFRSGERKEKAARWLLKHMQLI